MYFVCGNKYPYSISVNGRHLQKHFTIHLQNFQTYTSDFSASLMQLDLNGTAFFLLTPVSEREKMLQRQGTASGDCDETETKIHPFSIQAYDCNEAEKNILRQVQEWHVGVFLLISAEKDLSTVLLRIHLHLPQQGWQRHLHCWPVLLRLFSS